MPEETPTPAPLETNNVNPTIPNSLQSLTNLYGVNETKDVVNFVCKTVKAVKDSINDDGKITVGDALKFMAPVSALPEALVGISQVPLEFEDQLTDEELDEIAQVVIDNGLAANSDKGLIVTKKILKIAEQIKELVLTDFLG